MSDVVVTTGVDAAGDLQVQLADVLLVIQVSKTFADLEGDRNAPGVGESAEVEARAADGVCDQVVVAFGEVPLLELSVKCGQLLRLHIG